ncbi:MAG: hypothetical protein IJ400_06080 [Clostridia bacterium]|nr:hypothetical protein [Clostridia bacterium]
MGNFFNKIKQKALAIRVIKAFLCGLAVGLPTIGVLLLLYRFELVALQPVASSLIGVGLIIGVGVLVYLLLNQSDKSLAIRLDKEKGLSERIQTSLAFADQSGPMIDLQRQDADKKLMEVKDVGLGLKKIWIYILVAVIGIGSFGISFIFNPPPVEPPPPLPETPFKVTELQLLALEELVEYVSASEMDSPYKESIATALTTFIDEIKVAENETQRDVAIEKAMDEIFKQTSDSSYGYEVITSLWSTGIDTCRLLAKALNYYEWPKEDEWDRFVEKMTDYRTGFVHIDSTTENPDEEKMKEDVKTLLLSASQGIDLALQGSKIPNEDPLKLVLTRLSTVNESNADGTRIYGLYVLADFIEKNGYTKAQRELDATISALSPEIFKALSQNAINTQTGEYAMLQLAGIFGVKAPELERPELYESTDSDQPSGEGGGGGGAIGGGPTYGSDDKVYDPFTNKYVEYGTILDKYYDIMFGGLSSGDYTDEEKKALEEYFQILYGGFEEVPEESENENN